MNRQIRLAESKGKPRQMRPAEKTLFASQPTLGEAESIVLSCWNDLDASRAGGVGAIDWRAIRDWVREQGGEAAEVRVISQAIRVLDVDRAERMESERRTRTKPEKGRRR